MYGALPPILDARCTPGLLVRLQGVWEPQLPDAGRRKGFLTCSSQAGAGDGNCSACPATVPRFGASVFPKKFLFCSEELGRKVVWARARGWTEQPQEGAEEPGTGAPSPSSPRGRPGRGWAGADGLACQGSSVRRAHQKALTSLN